MQSCRATGVPAAEGKLITPHYHATIEHVLIYGISAIIVINLTRIVAAKLGGQPGALGAAGRSLGALVTFGGAQ